MNVQLPYSNFDSRVEPTSLLRGAPLPYSAIACKETGITSLLESGNIDIPKIQSLDLSLEETCWEMKYLESLEILKKIGVNQWRATEQGEDFLNFSETGTVAGNPNSYFNRILANAHLPWELIDLFDNGTLNLESSDFFDLPISQPLLKMLRDLGWVDSMKLHLNERGKKVLSRFGEVITYGGGYKPCLENLVSFMREGKRTERDSFRDTQGSAIMGVGGYFHREIELLKSHPYLSQIKCIIEPGCGDGTTLEMLKKAFPDITVAGIEFGLNQKPELKKKLSKTKFEVIDGSLTDIEAMKAFANNLGFLPEETLILTNHIVQEVIDQVKLQTLVEEITEHFWGFLVCDMVEHDTDVIRYHMRTSRLPEIMHSNYLTDQRLRPWSRILEVFGSDMFEESEIIPLHPLGDNKPIMFIALAKRKG